MLRRESYLTFPDQKDANARFLYPRGDAEISHYKTNRKSGKHCNYAGNQDQNMKITKSMKRYCSYVLSFTNRLYNEHYLKIYPSILVTFLGRPSILVGRLEH